MRDDRQEGPFSLESLPAEGVTPDTYVWCKGMDDWKKAEEVAEISRFFRGRILDMMHPSEPEPAELLPPENDTEDEEMPPFAHIVRKSGTEYSRMPEDEEDKSIPPRTWLIESIIVTIFCSITGFIGIYFALKCRRAWQDGNADMSYDYSRRAKMWTGISFFLGFITTAFFMSRYLL